MTYNHTIQTQAAFERIDDALLGKTDDNLSQIIRDLNYMLWKAIEISDTKSSFDDGSDYDPPSHCDIPQRY